MWAQLGIAALQGLSAENARKQNLASNVIKEKYSHWTQQNGDFSEQGQNKMGSALAGGFAAGMAQDQYDKALEKSDLAAQKAANDSDADFYSKLSADPSSVGVTPIGGKSSFSAIAKAAPAASRSPAAPQPPQSFQGMFDPQQPLMQQGPNPQQNPWLLMAQQYGGR
jgi:hypothetical protein